MARGQVQAADEQKVNRLLAGGTLRLGSRQNYHQRV